jgi:hypothetical protein
MEDQEQIRRLQIQDRERYPGVEKLPPNKRTREFYRELIDEGKFSDAEDLLREWEHWCLYNMHIETQTSLLRRNMLGENKKEPTGWKWAFWGVLFVLFSLITQLGQ